MLRAGSPRMADWAAVSLLRRHRQWAILIAAAVGLLVAAGAVSLTIVESVSKGPAFQKAADYVRADPVARPMQLGVVIGFGLAVSGPISRSRRRRRRANISFDVHGSWRSGHVTHHGGQARLAMGRSRAAC